MKFPSLIAIFAGLAGGVVADGGHPRRGLESATWTAPEIVVPHRETLVAGGDHPPAKEVLMRTSSWNVRLLPTPSSPVASDTEWCDGLDDKGLPEASDNKGEAALPGSPSGLSAEPPNPPAGVDPHKLQVWVRIDTELWRDEELENPMGLQHSALKALTQGMGGRHADVVIGNRDKWWWEYGMAFDDGDWKSRDSAEGHPVIVYAIDLSGKSTSRWEFKGVIESPRIKWPNSPILTKIAASVGAGTYSTKDWNCRTWSDRFVEKLRPLMMPQQGQSSKRHPKTRRGGPRAPVG
ncbi:hypothetical protein PpBr36_05508 [Pyricularia pennisetigena]|uniref:hypothetical protein n=1 Tax=Pyricularia pennisetigena TaxID=1578925 RepID=UPI0011514C16|nr:hypothetical protein PpBr36_05508 [Pyricularia pennisetigena]TLS27228.1 hypothetical protein PpBr36_05508 [Pyricularia pennisetigena]